MSRAREFADLAGSADAGGLTGRNVIINGAMNVAQRGTSFAAVSNEYTVDRFRYNKTGTDELVMTATQDSSAPNGFSNSLKLDVTTAEAAIASDERVEIETRIEAQNCRHFGMGTSDAKDLTLSFWVKSSITGTFGVNFRLHDADKSQGASYTISAADTWEYKTIKVTKTTSHSITNDNGIGMWVRWGLIVGSSFQDDSVVEDWVAPATGWYPTGLQSTWGTSTSHNFWLTGVQLEVGDKATSFEHRSYGEELALCQRYFQKTGNVGASNEWFPGVATYAGYGPRNAWTLKNTNDRAWVQERFPVVMRSSPTLTLYPGRGDVTNSAGNISHYNATTAVSWSSGPNGSCVGLSGYFTGISSDNLAGYSLHYTVDAEL